MVLQFLVAMRVFADLGEAVADIQSSVALVCKSDSQKGYTNGLQNLHVVGLIFLIKLVVPLFFLFDRSSNIFGVSSWQSMLVSV